MSSDAMGAMCGLPRRAPTFYFGKRIAHTNGSSDLHMSLQILALWLDIICRWEAGEANCSMNKVIQPTKPVTHPLLQTRSPFSLRGFVASATSGVARGASFPVGMHRAVYAAEVAQLRVMAVLDDPSLIEDEDPVRRLCGG